MEKTVFYSNVSHLATESGTEATMEGRFYNRTVIPSFFACHVMMTKIVHHEDGMKRVLRFVKAQNILTQHVWRENLINVAYSHPHLRIVQPYMSWPSFENSNDFAVNSYRYHLDDVLKLNRSDAVQKDVEVARAGNVITSTTTTTISEEKAKAFSVSLKTENVIDKLEKKGTEKYLAKHLSFEKTFERVKKMSKIHAFNKTDFVQIVISEITKYQKKVIVYEIDLRETYNDLKKIYSNVKHIEKSKIAREEREEKKPTREETDVGVEKNACKIGNVTMFYDESTGIWSCKSEHVTAREDYFGVPQPVIKKVLRTAVELLGDFAFPTCCVHANEDEKKDVRDFLDDAETNTRISMIENYLKYVDRKLKHIRNETTLNTETTQFLYDFAMRKHSKKTVSREEWISGLKQVLEDEGLQSYAVLKSLYPDKMKPKAVRDILEKMSLKSLYKLYYLFRVQRFASSFKTIPLDAETTKNIDKAMRYRRYGILDYKEELPASAYDVYLTPCCETIATCLAPESYGQCYISYKHHLQAYVCSKKMRKKVSPSENYFFDYEKGIKTNDVK
jgi:hypothetical protein